ncbi:HDOD domain-containing protein [Pseudomonas asuensis]|uniref:HDOD domain-containing protein n=1 Tax=Pseudomonas asuensis TaxID=1825787 RepID=A0ABQ2GJ22_9PSED|nr:HDOD domain-containing protein [Pseudomonas asuensis]GGL98774.1 HDOD domain-containing protein [Pseudomonas asuensis]
MSATTARPNTLDAWLKKLESVRLSIPTEVKEDVRRALANGNKTIPEIAEAALQSPILSLVLLRESNRSQLGRENPAVSLEVALNRLGLGPAEYLLSALPSESKEKYSPALSQLLLISEHAMAQANGLFGNTLARLRQEVRLSTLLFLAPVWPLVQAYPELWEEWEQRVLGNNEPAIKVEQELLGVPLLDLCLTLAERWSLPAWVVDGYRLLVKDRRRLVKALHIAHNDAHPLQQQQRLDEDLPLRRWLTQPGNTILLANGLAVASHQSWSNPHILRWQRLVGLYMHESLDHTQQITHQAAAQHARQQFIPGLWHPAEALIWPWNARRLRPNQKTTPDTEAANKRQPADDGLNAWRRHCAELVKTPTPFTNGIQLTACARDALAACGLSRLILLTLDADQALLISQGIHGLPEAAKGLQLPINNHPLLRKLMSDPAQLRITPENSAQFRPHLPGNLQALFPHSHMVLRSIGSKGRVSMLVIIDKGGEPFSEQDQQAINKTVTCIERGVASYAQRLT